MYQTDQLNHVKFCSSWYLMMRFIMSNQVQVWDLSIWWRNMVPDCENRFGKVWSLVQLPRHWVPGRAWIVRPKVFEWRRNSQERGSWEAAEKQLQAQIQDLSGCTLMLQQPPSLVCIKMIFLKFAYELFNSAAHVQIVFRYKFLRWYDYESWYPIGRPIGTTQAAKCLCHFQNGEPHLLCSWCMDEDFVF